MDFTLEFYETESGRCPVREFLDDLKGSDPGDFAIVMAGLAKLRNKHYHRPPFLIGQGHCKAVQLADSAARDKWGNSSGKIELARFGRWLIPIWLGRSC